MRILTRAVVAAALFALAGCSVWPVDQDPKGMDYRRNANEVIDALQAWHRDKGAFPASLGALTAGYLRAIPDEPHLDYHPADGSLSYRYTPSWPQLRPVWCQSVGNSTDWKCQEHLI
jgi:hypothetical protein